MKIYGVAILAGCFLVGQIVGEFLGIWLGIDGNIGGVGFAMLLLILLGDWMKKKGFLNQESEKGIYYWSAMYIPVVVAMSSIQNVKAALSGGWVALLVAIISTGICFLLVPIIAKIKL
jgi:malonate transporter MadL subunit